MSIFPTAPPDPREAVIAHFAALAPLSRAETEALRRSLQFLSAHPAGRELVGVGARLDTPRLVISGWAGRTATLPDGRRQILDFYLPGDPIGYSPRAGARALAPTIALTPLETAPIAELIGAVKLAGDDAPGLAEAWRVIETQLEIRVLHQLVRNGRQTAFERMAHLLLEFHDRLMAGGFVHEHRFAMPLTQEVFADAVGLSTVHVNRTMQQLRREGLIRAEDGVVTILDPARLATIAGRRGYDDPVAATAGAWQARTALPS